MYHTGGPATVRRGHTHLTTVSAPIVLMKGVVDVRPVFPAILAQDGRDAEVIEAM